MSRHFSFADLWRKSRFPLIVFGLMYYFGSALMSGENGFHAKRAIKAELENKQVELAALRSTRESLDKKVSLMAPGNLDRDLLDEQARLVLGLADRQELVIILEEGSGNNAATGENRSPD